MAPSAFTHHNQPPTLNPGETEKTISPLTKNPTTVLSGASSNKANPIAIEQKQEMLSKTELAPDWVWDYGIMG
jgi:hypothetical protein